MVEPKPKPKLKQNNKQSQGQQPQNQQRQHKPAQQPERQPEPADPNSLSEDVPRLFRAQIDSRCQVHRPTNKYQDICQLAEEWTGRYPAPPPPPKPDPSIPIWKRQPSQPRSSESPAPSAPTFGLGVETKCYTLSWRLAMNGGQDDTLIRPAIGAGGYPYYPGSSMKGAFRRACKERYGSQKAEDYCGREPGKGEDESGTMGNLRFHGGYPVDNTWTQNIVDVIHAQQDKQVIADKTTNANTQLSLCGTTLRFGISSRVAKPQDWSEIWGIWERALAEGLGSRVSAAYGRFQGIEPARSLLAVSLSGQGIASTLLDSERTPELRPNGFKAALRGHTLRLLGGMTNNHTAKSLAELLWGGIDGSDRRRPTVGKLGISLSYQSGDITYPKHTYTVRGRDVKMRLYQLQRGTLHVFAMSAQEAEYRELTALATALARFTLLFGGFGKSWRRVDHHLFFKSYINQGDKPAIGCHWKFLNDSRSLYLDLPPDDLTPIGEFVNQTRQQLQHWAESQSGWQLGCAQGWREAWYPYQPNRGGVQVWGQRTRKSKAVCWFHKNYEGNKSIKKTAIAGGLGRTGRIWHRMYPVGRLDANGQPSGDYVELLTIFPDASHDTQQFLEFLAERTGFHLLY